MRVILSHLVNSAATFFRDFPFESIFAAIGVGTTIWRVVPWARRNWERRSAAKHLRTRLGAEVFSPEEILAATRFYIQHDCQNIDPAGGEAWRRDSPVRQSVFEKLDQLFENPEYRHTILLADTGMGKTAMLLNYFVRSLRKRRRHRSLAVVPLGHPKADELIKSVPNKADTVLLLDAFDEDIRATEHYRSRLLEILDETSAFRHVLISCRTQFFRSDNEIPRETGIMRFAPTGGAQEHQYIFHKLYLSPFDQKQVEMYLRKRWSVRKLKFRNKARRICEGVGDLALRPMILTNLEALLETDEEYEHSTQIYERIVEYWINRESAHVPRPSLRTFSERIAGRIYTKREELGSERLPYEEADAVARECRVSLAEWQIRTRSLLNRDAEGRLKFAHRSIMEYLYICDFVTNPRPQPRWTDQMAKFFIEIGLFHNADRHERSRLSAVHVDRKVRETLVDRVLDLDPGSLRQFPISLGVTVLEHVHGNRFLVVLIGPKELLLMSWRQLPGEYLVSHDAEFRILQDIPVLGEHTLTTRPITSDLFDKLRHFYRIGFGTDAGSIWKGKDEYYGRDYVGKSFHLAFSASITDAHVHTATSSL